MLSHPKLLFYAEKPFSATKWKDLFANPSICHNNNNFFSTVINVPTFTATMDDIFNDMKNLESLKHHDLSTSVSYLTVHMGVM